MPKPDSQAKNRTSKGTFKKGVSGNPLGPAPGYKNKAMKIKLGFFEAFDKLGGVKGLVEWAQRNGHRSDFYRILVQLLPKDIDLGIQDDLIEKYKEFSANELIEKSKVLAREIITASRSDGNTKEAKKAKSA